MVKGVIVSSYEEALTILSQEDVIILGGGTDLMVKNRSWSNLDPKMDKKVMFVGQLEELQKITKNGHHFEVGAAVTLEALLKHDDTPVLLKEAIAHMASPAIRHSGTLVGNVGNASPAGDTLPVLYLLEAEIMVESAYGKRWVPIEDFIVGPGQTVLLDDEIIRSIKMTDHRFDKQSFRKVGGRKADAISKISFCAGVEVIDGYIADFKVAYGAVGPTVVRNREIEMDIIDKDMKWLKENISLILEKYDDCIKPIDDQRSSRKYRKVCSINLLEDFLMHLE